MLWGRLSPTRLWGADRAGQAFPSPEEYTAEKSSCIRVRPPTRCTYHWRTVLYNRIADDRV
jgi:hypothetical protein